MWAHPPKKKKKSWLASPNAMPQNSNQLKEQELEDKEYWW